MSPHLLDQLSSYLDGELSPAEAAAVQAHLRDCPACAGRLAELAAVDELARGLPVEVPAGYYESFPARIREKLPRREPGPRRLPVWALAAAAVLLVAVITPLTLRERSVGPAVTEMPRSVEAPPAAPSPAGPQESDQPPVRGEPERPATRKAEAGKGRAETGAAGVGAPAKTVGDAEDRRRVSPPRQAPMAPPLPQVAAAAPGRSPTDAGRAAGAPSASGPWAQAPTQGQTTPSTVALQPGGRPAQEAIRDDSALEEKVTVEGALAKPKADQLGANRAAGLEDADTEFETLRARRGGTASEARDLRAAWRRFAAENPSHPRADEARVAAIEAGVVAFRLGHRPADRAQVEADVKAYLAGPNPAKADLARALLASLDRF